MWQIVGYSEHLCSKEDRTDSYIAFNIKDSFNWSVRTDSDGSLISNHQYNTIIIITYVANLSLHS